VTGLARVEGLHVDVQVGVELARASEEVSQAHCGVALAELRGIGSEQRGERRDLDRQVLARDAPGAVGFERRALGELAVDLDEPVERLADSARRSGRPRRS
jgi:hypothetical protein